MPFRHHSPELEAMAIVVSGDTRDRLEHRTFERYAEAEAEERALKPTASAEERKAATVKVLDAKAIAEEFGALGKECR